MTREEDLVRIENGLNAAREALKRFTSGDVPFERKKDKSFITEADLAVNDVLHRILPAEGDGWLSEETVDDPARLECRRVWIVDPVDGTQEFVQGLPEWCVSIGLVEDGRAVAGGILNPAAYEMVLGSLETGVSLNGRPARVSSRPTLKGATVLASRSEIRRGEWERFDDAPFTVVPMGSVAYKLARVAAGLDDIMFTLVPKSEWDIAAGVALIEAAGGKITDKEGEPFTFNRPKPKVTGAIAAPVALYDQVVDCIRRAE